MISIHDCLQIADKHIHTYTNIHTCTCRRKWQANEQQMSVSGKLKLRTGERWWRVAVKQRRSKAPKQSNRCTIFYHFEFANSYTCERYVRIDFTVCFGVPCKCHTAITWRKNSARFCFSLGVFETKWIKSIKISLFENWKHHPVLKVSFKWNHFAYE